MSVRLGPLVAIAALSLLLVTGCASSPSPSGVPTEAGPRVVATTTVLGELASRIVGDSGSVEVLMEPGQDPHDFAPSAQQAQALRRADLVIAIGLGLEESLDDVLRSAEEDGTAVLRVGEHLSPLEPDSDQGGEHEGDHDDHEGAVDPHVWLDPVRMADAASLIASAIGQLDTASDRGRDARAAAVADELVALDERIDSILAPVPERCRVLLTAHDSLRYFADRYGFEVIGSIIPGTSTQATASAGHVAELVDVIASTGIPAVFAETSESSRLAETLAAEVGRDIEVVELPAGTIGEPGSPTGTYAGMMTVTAERIAAALNDC